MLAQLHGTLVKIVVGDALWTDVCVALLVGNDFLVARQIHTVTYGEEIIG